MTMTANDYVRRQTAEMMQALNEVAHHPVGLSSPEQTLITTPSSGWQWDSVGNGNVAFVRSRPSTMLEYWVHVDFTGYRPAFLDFVEQTYGLPSEAVSSRWHVDHMLNRAFARNHGISFVRCALLGQDSNVSYGRLLERRISTLRASSKPMYLIDYLVMMKLLDIPVPTSAQDFTARRDTIAGTFVANGFDGSKELVLQGLDGMFTLWPVIG